LQRARHLDPCVDICAELSPRHARELWSASGMRHSSAARRDIDDGGLLVHPGLNGFRGRTLRACSMVGEYYRSHGIATDQPFLEQVHFDFGVADPAQHVHLPFKMHAWGFPVSGRCMSRPSLAAINRAEERIHLLGDVVEHRMGAERAFCAKPFASLDISMPIDDLIREAENAKNRLFNRHPELADRKRRGEMREFDQREAASA